jgi:tryptophan synthase alpha subunit
MHIYFIRTFLLNGPIQTQQHDKKCNHILMFFKSIKKQSGHLSFAYLSEEYKIYAILIPTNEFEYKESFAITPIDLNIFLFFLFTFSTKSQEDLMVYHFTVSQLSTSFGKRDI